MKPFTRQEILGLGVIFLVLIAISAPNFVLSLRRARDQVRRDDLGAIQNGLEGYSGDFHSFPTASFDGRIMDCAKPGSSVTMDKKGQLIVDLVACNWGVDPLINLIPGANKIYMSTLPRDPSYQKGPEYIYYSDGQRYQIFAYMEGGNDEADYDPRIVARHIMCGTEVCNVGRSYNVPIGISIEEYDKQLQEQNAKK